MTTHIKGDPLGRSYTPLPVAQGEGWTVRLGRWQDSPPDQVDHVISDPPFTDHVSKNAKQRLGLAFRSKADRLRKQAADPDLEVYGCEGLSFGGIAPHEIGPGIVAHVRRWTVLFCAIEQVGQFQQACPDEYLRGGWWRKTNASPQFTGDRPASPGEAIVFLHPKGKKKWNRGGHKAEWSGPSSHGTFNAWDERVHETQKPLWLMLELIEAFTDPGDLVWDPYMGSATTGVACLMRGRRFLGHEMQEGYYQASIERLQAAEQGMTLGDARAGQLGFFQ